MRVLAQKTEAKSAPPAPPKPPGKDDKGSQDKLEQVIEARSVHLSQLHSATSGACSYGNTLK